MQIYGAEQRSLCYDEVSATLRIIDQTRLPFEFCIVELNDLAAVCEAITTMQVRGAPLIGATAAYGLALALRDDHSLAAQGDAVAALMQTRPTAINLHWALERMVSRLQHTPRSEAYRAALDLAAQLCEEDIATNRRIGEAGLALIKQLADKKERVKPGGRAEAPVNILTHCNAGALATVDWGTALAPIYLAHQQGIAVHVWVDETRPRNQGASLTTWELGRQGVPFTLVSDNSGGHLMQQGMVDICLVGSDRTTANGDVCNKVGTYLKALAARDNQVPFYVCLPVSTIDWGLATSGDEIPIEYRDPAEVTHVLGEDDSGVLHTVSIAPQDCPALNPAFDVTPARLVTGLVTDHGIFAATPAGLAELRGKLDQTAGDDAP